MSFNPVTYRSLPDYSRLDSQRYIQPLDGRYDDGFTTRGLNERYESQRARINNADIISQTKNQGIQDQIIQNLRDANAANLKGSLGTKNPPSLLERLNALDNPQKPAAPTNQPVNRQLASALQPAQRNDLFATLGNTRPYEGAVVTGPNAQLNAQDLSGQVNINFSGQAQKVMQDYRNSAATLVSLSNQGVDPRMAQAAIAAQLGPQLAATGIGRMGALGPMTQLPKTQATAETKPDTTGAGASKNGYTRKRMTDKMNAMLAKHQNPNMGQSPSGQAQPQLQQAPQQLAQQLRQKQLAASV